MIVMYSWKHEGGYPFPDQLLDLQNDWSSVELPYPKERDRGVKEVKEEVQGRAHAMHHLKENVPSAIGFTNLLFSFYVSVKPSQNSSLNI